MKKISKKLEAMKKDANALQHAVIDDLLDAGNNDEIISYIQDIMRGGCPNGVVSSLIHYHDTALFFRDFEDEIVEVIKESGASIEDIIGKNDTKISNALAWAGYEFTVYNIAAKLEIEFKFFLKKYYEKSFLCAQVF